MFKALLKTLPSLSGNMKLACFVDDYNRHNKIYSCNVKRAKLLPISHTLYDKNIYVNLKNNAFEYDVKQFYKNYFDVFYKSNYNYSQINIPIIDYTTTSSDCNEDFLFGCKRISYTKYENQLAFFAPFYFESIDDIKDKYFKITCIFENTNKVKKQLIIDIYDNSINEHEGNNYLADYLIRYGKNIDDKVIYMSNTYKNMYCGIDLLHGGFIQVEDNISKNLYNKYYTINDFDAIINFGFKRNTMMMKQIIPLSFYFNPENLLTDYEKSIYKDAKITVYGEWYTKGNDKNEEFYDFSDNYNFYSESIYQLTNTNKFTFIDTNKNIMDMNYPAFKEASSENYKYINTIIKNYNRWKLKYSSDEYPYIINNNFAFSNNQNSLFSYKEFPLLYKSKKAICKFKNEQYNMLFDLDNIFDKSGKLLNVKSEYYDLFNKNYIGSFYNLLVKNDNSESYENIFTNDEYWTTIDKDDKLYYKGVLYDFNKIYSEFTDMPKIDKFSIFVNPEMMTYITNEEYNNTYNSVKYTINSNDILNTIEEKINENTISYLPLYLYSYEFITENLSYITNNETVFNDCRCLVHDKNGDYVDINGYFINNNEEEKLHYNTNLYVDINELFTYNSMNVEQKELYNKIYNSENLNIVHGYRLIDINYKNNIISELYQELLSLYPNNKYMYNNDNLIYSEHKLLQNDDIYWAYDKLYFSIYPNIMKYKLLENSSLLYDLVEDTKITLYFETDFIKSDDLKSICNDYIEVLNKYYISNTLYDKDENQSYSDTCFVQIKKTNDYGKYTLYDFSSKSLDEPLEDFNEDVLFIDTYNLNNLYKSLFNKDNLSFYKVKDCYCNFLNLDHVYKYLEKLNKDENLNISSTPEDNIYIKLHLLNNIVIDIEDTVSNINYINTTTRYINIKEYFQENIDIYELLNYIGYNDNGYFYFTNDYFNNILNNLEDGDRYKIKNFELCFKKTMGIVNESLYKLIMQMNIYGIFKDLYIYRLYKNTDYKFEYVMNNKIIYDDDNDSSIIYDQNYVELYPYFNSIYNEEKINTKIYNDSFLNNIIKCINSDTYKYGSYNIDTLVYMPKDKQHNLECLCPYRYSLYTKYNNGIIDSDTFVRKYMNYQDESSYSYFKNYNKMITYTQTIGENVTTYGFYIIHEEFDNTRNTLNLLSENLNNINVVSYINDIYVQDIYNNQNTYLTQYYHNIIPYINNSNIVKDFLNNVDIIIKPSKYTLTNIYQQIPNINSNNNEINSYNIIIKGKTNLQLLRYFDNIVPYIVPTNNLTSYHLYYKNSNKFIENDLYNKNISYIMYQKTQNIYDHKYISYFDIDNEQNLDMSYLNLRISEFVPIEYKNYNNNKFFNLEQTIKITLKSNNVDHKNLFIKSEIDQIEKDKDKIYQIFKEYLLKQNKLLTESDILFLYNKYDVKFSHTIKSFHKNNLGERDYDLYTLTIKYNLF